MIRTETMQNGCYAKCDIRNKIVMALACQNIAFGGYCYWGVVAVVSHLWKMT